MKCIIWNLPSVQLEIVLVLVQHSCMVFAQCTIGSETVVEFRMVLRGEEAQVKARFSLFGDSANLDER
jgi:hypothetical protein